MEAGFLSALSFAWFYLSSGSPVSKHSKNGECSCSHGLQAFISHTRLSKELFVFLPLLSFGSKLALRRIAKEDTDEVRSLFALFACFIVHLDFLSRKAFLRTRLVRIFLFGHPPFSKRVGRSIENDHYRGVLEYSLTSRHSTVSENQGSP